MIKLGIQVLILLTILTPSIVGAETFKCKNTDGRIIYSDSKCPIGTTSETTMPTTTNAGTVGSTDSFKRKTPSYMPDETCIQENQTAGKYCAEASIVMAKQCMRARLSPSCVKQYESGPGAIQAADEACKQEIRAAATPCTQTQITSGQQCIQDRLSQKCRDQTSKFNVEFEKSRKQCEDAMLRMRKACPGSNDAFLKCMQEHQVEIKASCKDL